MCLYSYVSMYKNNKIKFVQILDHLWFKFILFGLTFDLYKLGYLLDPFGRIKDFS